MQNVIDRDAARYVFAQMRCGGCIRDIRVCAEAFNSMEEKPYKNSICPENEKMRY